jgi:adenosylcobinamide-GDP ribazoletransferase
MKKFLHGLAMALGMFSILPMPHVWDGAAAHLVMPLFPLAGAVIGLAWWGLAALLAAAGAPRLLAAGLLALAPLFFSGFIHVDGYMDTADALGSRRGLEEQRRILKDPNVGAFGSVALGALLLLFFCAVYEAPAGPVLVLIPTLVRGVVGFGMLGQPTITPNGFAATFQQGAGRGHRAALGAICALCLAAAWGLGVGWPVTAAGAAAGLALACACKRLAGVSGDLCGFALVLGELAGVVVLAVQ